MRVWYGPGTPKRNEGVPGPYQTLKARRTGLEPATTGSTGRYSNQLSYRPNWEGGFYHGSGKGQGVVCQELTHVTCNMPKSLAFY